MQDVKHTPATQELPDRAIRALVILAVVLFFALLAIAYQEHEARAACDASAISEGYTPEQTAHICGALKL